MSYNSNSFSVSVTTTETNLSLPTNTSSLNLTAPIANSDFINIKIGSGSPIKLNPGDNKTIDIETICQTIVLSGGQIPPQVFITSMSYTANSGTQALNIIPQEWRLS